LDTMRFQMLFELTGARWPTSNGLNVRFVTVTVNAVDPKVGARIYTQVSKGDDMLQRLDTATLLMERQTDVIAGLKAKGLVVKVNTVVIPGVNDTHSVAVAERISRLKADLHNLIALIPVPGTSRQDTAPPSTELMASLRHAAKDFIPQMRHCVRCRSDAVGLLHDDRSCTGAYSAAKPERTGTCPSSIRNGLEARLDRAAGLLRGMQWLSRSF
jgi:nitrogen fixation protein NifB